MPTKTKTATYKKTKGAQTLEERVDRQGETLEQMKDLLMKLASSENVPQIVEEDVEEKTETRNRFKKLSRIGRAPEFSVFETDNLKFDGFAQMSKETKKLKYYTLKFEPVSRQNPKFPWFWPKYLQAHILKEFLVVLRNYPNEINQLIEEIEYVNSSIDLDEED